MGKREIESYYVNCFYQFSDYSTLGYTSISVSVTVFFSARKLQHINIIKAIFPFCILAPDFDSGEHTKLILTKGSAQSNRGKDSYRHAGLEQVMRRHVTQRYQL